MATAPELIRQPVSEPSTFRIPARRYSVRSARNLTRIRPYPAEQIDLDFDPEVNRVALLDDSRPADRVGSDVLPPPLVIDLLLRAENSGARGGIPRMDPVTIITTAVAVGTAAGVTDTAKQSVADAYSALKSLITRRYRGVDLRQVENMPESTAERESLAQALSERGAADDHELVAAARDLITAVRTGSEGAGAVVGVDLEMVEAAALRISGVSSQGIGVRVRGGHFSGDIDIHNIVAGPGEPPHPA
ncbi:hypothetical protein OHB12_22885 [Nocardia sp. NBC_01730]|uniref:hypothetical protein n=1 Tax=Nocardia sp. NBC_01730 TaxID=2975998 RepID=UPI002E128DFD|nr:hypothetical protein OHB12_22885 [Nocardia sp. NBC_01730]